MRVLGTVLPYDCVDNNAAGTVFFGCSGTYEHELDNPLWVRPACTTMWVSFVHVVRSFTTPPERSTRCQQALGVVVIGAVAFLVVAQEHIRRLHSGEENAVHGGETGNGNSGLAGLSLTYALPIVGGCSL